jgi:hypothetical protein
MRSETDHTTQAALMSRQVHARSNLAGAPALFGAACSLLTLGLVALLGLTAANSRASPTHTSAAERLMFVDCMLPGVLRKLGGRMMYQGPRRAERTTVDDCEIRGGEYTAYDRADPASALAAWLPQAQQGDATAQVYVGELYEKGVGTGPDYSQAAQWYEKAASAGSSEGKNHLAYLYEQGRGVPQDRVRAENLYREAAGLTSDQLIFRSELDTRVAELGQRLLQQAQELTRLSDDLERTRAQLDAQRMAAAQARRTAGLLRAKLQSTQATGDLHQQLAAQEQQLAQEEQQVAALERTAEEQAGRLARELKDSQQADGLAAPGTAEGTNVTSQLAAARAMQEALKQEAAQLREEAGRLKATLDDAHALQQVTSGQLAELTADLQRREAVASRLDAERQHLQDEVQHLQAQLRASQSAAAQTEASLQAQVAVLEAEKVARSRQIADLLVHVQADSLALAEARERLAQADLAERETNLQKELARVRGLRAGVKSDQTQIDALHGQLVRKGAVGSPSPAPVAGDAADGGRLGMGPNFALVIANARYRDGSFPALPSVEKDARAVVGALGRYGFKGRMTLVQDGTRDDIMNAVAAFSAQLGPDDSAIIYYTGHGALVEANSASYWLPSDALPGVPASWVATSWVTEMIGQMRARHILVVVDSCYAGVLVHSTNIRMVSRSAAAEPERIRALARLPSRTVLTSGGNEPVASEGPGGYSVFARQFTQILEHNNQVLDASSLYDALSDAMSRAGSGAGSPPQLPRYSILVNTHHLNGDFLFVPSSPPRS